MKSILVLSVLALFAISCGKGSDSNSPAGIEKSMYTQMQKGNYEKAIEILIDHLDTDKDASAEEKAQLVMALTEKAKQSGEEKSIQSFEIVEENISEDGLSATVTTKTVDKAGKEDTQTTKYVKKDGQWKISLGK